jgi:hypothetical protein
VHSGIFFKNSTQVRFMHRRKEGRKEGRKKEEEASLLW